MDKEILNGYLDSLKKEYTSSTLDEDIKQLSIEMIQYQSDFLNILNLLKNDEFHPLDYLFLYPKSTLGQKHYMVAVDDPEERKRIIHDNKKHNPSKYISMIFEKNHRNILKIINNLKTNVVCLTEKKLALINQSNQDDIDKSELITDQLKMKLNQLNLALISLNLNENFHDLSMEYQEKQPNIDIINEDIEYSFTVKKIIEENNLMNVNESNYLGIEAKKLKEKIKNISKIEYFESCVKTLSQILEDEFEIKDVRDLIKNIYILNVHLNDQTFQPSDFIKQAINNKTELTPEDKVFISENLIEYTPPTIEMNKNDIGIGLCVTGFSDEKTYKENLDNNILLLRYLKKIVPESKIENIDIENDNIKLHGFKVTKITNEMLNKVKDSILKLDGIKSKGVNATKFVEILNNKHSIFIKNNNEWESSSNDNIELKELETLDNCDNNNKIIEANYRYMTNKVIKQQRMYSVEQPELF